VKWLGNILGVLLSLMGVIWILQGTDILKTGFMAGHLQYALFGLVALAVGIALIAISNRRRNKLSGGGSTPRA
jgi:LPXTG-motif cell wall-anchored protein